MGQMHGIYITVANYTLAPVDTSIHQPRSTGSMCALTEDEPESLTLCRCIASSIALRGYGDSFIHPAHAGNWREIPSVWYNLIQFDM